MRLIPGSKLGTYEIRSPLGAGGMGEVYRATDTNLGRDVALKVLPADMAQDAERLGRFRREAKTLAQLDHPNIVTIYSVEQSEDVHFLTMQLVDGEPLDRLITEGGMLLERIVEIGGAVADALAAAHDKGIVHRDLKPANVMVSNEGRVKVLDFGLAKDVRANLGGATMTSANQTQVGVVMGTPAYMSPEQTSGRPLDHRSDIFSLGVVLHEMATGRCPFEGTSSAELISAILRDTPASVNESRPDLPADLARIIRRCLEKDPRHRIQTARDVSNEFRDLARQISQKPAPARTAASRPPLAAESGAVRADEGFWIAVLPFKYSGSNAELSGFAEGLAEEIITGLSRFSYLRVIAHASTAKYSNEAGDVRAVGRELGARYVMQGSLRQAGAKVRIAVQLVDAASGAGLWAETYDRAFTPESILDLLDDVVSRIVATVGDTQGILPHSMTESLRNRDPESLTPYEALLRSFGFHQHVSAAEHLAGRTALERAVKQAPDRADCWAMLSWLYRAEYSHEYNVQPAPMDRALAAARRAVELSPSSQLAQAALASAHFFRREFGSFRSTAERALALNIMEGYTTAFLGMQFAFSGDWERGCALSERSTQLNPNHPGWYWFPMVMDAYRRKDGHRALDYALKMNMPGLWTAHVVLAVIYSQIGEMERAQGAVRDLLAMRPEFATQAREELGKWWQPEMVEQMLSDLRKAGLNAPESVVAPALPSGAVPTRTASGETRASEGFWVAVLPFKYTGSNEELKSLAGGLSDEVITGLSRFSYLRVIARGSTAKYSSESGDVRIIGKELGARYVMEGSLRHTGSKLRLAVQLADATTGSQVWAETYERSFNSETVFEIQDELVPRIVSTVADAHGILPHTMGESIRSKDPEELSPYEAVLRCFSYAERISPEEHAIVREALERAVEVSPTYAYAWAMLSLAIKDELESGFNPKPDPLERMLTAARRAVELDPSGHRGYHALAMAHFFRKEIPAFRSAADRAIALNPLDGCNVAHLGSYIAYAGEWERGCGLVERALQMNPNHPGWFWFPLSMNAYRKGDYQAALGYALKINLPNFLWTHVMLAAIYGQLGQQEEAAKAVQEMLKLNPQAAQIACAAFRTQYEPEFRNLLIEGLQKAGLDIGDEAAPSPAQSSASVAMRTASGESRSADGFWVAVLPFRYSGHSADVKALAEGLSDEVITGLSRFSYLRVIARGSSAKYSSESGDVRAIGREVGARYVMEGSIRQAGSTIRLAVQLADATTGTHLWAETFERVFHAEQIFALQDELVPRIVSTVADQHGILTRSICAAIRKQGDEHLGPYEAIFRVFGLHETMTEREHAACRDLLERVVREAPEAADCWAMLATLYSDEDWFGFNLRPDPLGRAAAAAQRATGLAPTSALAAQALAQSLFMRHEWQALRPVAEHAIALNPMDGATVALIGLLMACSGNWERGCIVADSAMKLHPNFPGWYWLAKVFNAYRTRDYRAAIDTALRIQMPGYFWTAIVLAAAYGQLGEMEAAHKAYRELLAVRPHFAATARQELGKWFDAELAEHFMDGLRKAGLESANVAVTAHTSSSISPSGAKRANEGFWIAVLPFKYTGTSADLKSLTEGLSEEIITGLSRFSYLRVIARGSTAKYSSESGDVRAIGQEVGARYVMEGSLRQAGNKLRLAVQLVDTVSGAHLWAESYERAFTPETVFDVQDDLVPRIVATVADQYGVLPRSMSDVLRHKDENALTPHEAVLRAFSYFTRITPEEHAATRSILERSVREAPNHADSWAMLSMLYRGEFAQGFNAAPNSLDRALAAAQRAVDLAPTHALGHYALATVYFFRKELVAFRVEVERALALNPLDASVRAYLGLLIAAAGEWDRGCQMVDSAVQLNPNCPGYFYFAGCCNAYRQGKYAEVLEGIARINMPNYFHLPALRAAALGQLGRREEAQKALRDLLALRPDFANAAREEYDKWYDSEQVEHILEGLRKAGLEISDKAETASSAASDGD